jgi:DsbC/DsbD-like thiol-disulfide interchange protein
MTNRFRELLKTGLFLCHALPAWALCVSLPLWSGAASMARAGSVSAPLTTTLEPGVSTWSAGLHSGARLLDGGADPAAGAPDGTRLAGIEIRLDPHYKTYWRSPGDSGLPPAFDWSASTNLRSVQVSWPAPTRFEDSAGSSIGYKDRVVFPLAVTPLDPGKPVVLELRMDYAVCEQVCIPAHAEPRLVLGHGNLSTPQAARIGEALAEVPASQPLSASAMPGIRSVRAGPGGGFLVVEAQVPDTKGLVDIFTEGPEGWTFSAPLAVATAALPGGHGLTYRIKVDARPSGGTLKDLPVSLTMVAGDESLVVATRLDATASAP